MIQYYKRGFENILATSYKAVIAVLTIMVCIPPYIRYNRTYATGGCAKDVVMTFEMKFYYPLIMLMALFFFIRLCLRDSSKNVIIRYKSKRKMWTYQSMSGLIFSTECILIIYAVAIIFGLLFFRQYDVWKVSGSYFYKCMKAEGYSVDAYNMPDVWLYILTVAMKVLVMSTTINVVLIVEYMTGKSVFAVLTIVLLCGLDMVSYSGVMGLLDYVIIDFVNMSYALEKLVIALFVNLVTFAAGWYLSIYREYY